jgi:large subunit ribosomal protein L21e
VQPVRLFSRQCPLISLSLTDFFKKLSDDHILLNFQRLQRFWPFKMGHSEGLRWGTRYLFARKNKKHGAPAPSIELRTYRIGDIVDIRVNGAVHKGMPHRIYHGTTGVVWNVSPRAVGLLIYRRVNNHIAPKRIYVRTEHIAHSKCKDEFKRRVIENQKAHVEAKKNGVKLEAAKLKRLPEQPKEAHVCKPETVKTICFTPFREVW